MHFCSSVASRCSCQGRGARAGSVPQAMSFPTLSGCPALPGSGTWTGAAGSCHCPVQAGGRYFPLKIKIKLKYIKKQEFQVPVFPTCSSPPLAPFGQLLPRLPCSCCAFPGAPVGLLLPRGNHAAAFFLDLEILLSYKRAEELQFFQFWCRKEYL